MTDLIKYNITFDIVIPCLFSHFNKLPDVIDSFLSFQMINKIIIVVNNLHKNNLNLNILKNKPYYHKMVFLTFFQPMPPGKAREIGLKISSGDYIIFHDADDIAHPQKLEIIHYFFKVYDPDHILHLIQPVNFNFINYNLDTINYLNTPEIKKYYEKHQNLDFGDILGKRLSHGLISIKREKALKINWEDKISGEDKAFNLSSLNNGNKIFIVDTYLSKYDRYHERIMKKYHPKAYQELSNYKINNETELN